MEYAQVKEALNECVRDFKVATKERHLTDQIRLKVSTEFNILVYEGLEMMADIMGVEIKEKLITGNGKYRYSFVYDDVEFVAYENERLERFVGNGK